MTEYRFGKLPPKVDYRTLNFGYYLKDDIPEPPPEIDQEQRARNNTGQQDVRVLFPMYANDQLGDCTIAGMAHGVTLYHGMVSQLHIPQQSEVVRIYFHLTGGIDSGLYMLDVLKYWRSEGIEDSKIYAYVNVNHNNRTHVKQAIQVFGGLFMGFQCQEKVIQEFNAGVAWRPGKKINFGHAVFVTGYDSEGVEVLTWGATHKGTWSWWHEHVDECYALLPPEAAIKEFTPGFDFARLRKDLAEVSVI